MTAWLLTMMGRLDPSPRFGRRPGWLAQLLGYPAGMASKAGNRRALLVGGGLVAFAVAVVVAVALAGLDRDVGAEAGKRLAKPRLLSTSLVCPQVGPKVVVRIAPGKARRVSTSVRLTRDGERLATGSVTRRTAGGRVTVRVPVVPASDLLLPWCRLVEGSSLGITVVARRGREKRRLVRRIEGDRYRAEPTRRIVLGEVGEPVAEASGLVESRRSPGTFYTHDDSGGEPEIYVLADDGRVVATQPLDGVVNRDWEDIALGPGRSGGSIYVGEIGDNGGSEDSIVVYRIPEPELDGQPDGTVLPPVVPEMVELLSPDGARDAEALFVDPASGDLYVISKRESRSRVYRASSPAFAGETVTLEFLNELPLGGVVAADVCPDGQTVLAKTYFGVYAFVSGSGVARALAGESSSRPFEPQISFSQDESIAADPWCTGYSVLPEGEGAPLARYVP